MENIVAWILFFIVGSALAYLLVAKVIIPLIELIKENARLK
ncbi:MAG: hypothetical protein WAO24_03755 [Peptococcia bacterium]